MNQIIQITEELKGIIKSSVREAIAEERLKWIQVLIPSVSKKEMDDIRKRFGNPSDYNKDDFKDMTAWFSK